MHCSVLNCDRQARARGYCHKHLNQFYLTGDPVPKSRPRGTGTITRDGYHVINGRQVHVTVAERALGKPLPHGAQVHHVDGNPANNEPSNLVICPNVTYHRLLHIRARAKFFSGNPNWRHCTHCKHYDDPANMRCTNGTYYHRQCKNDYNRKRRE